MDDAGASFSIQRKKKEQPEFKLKKNTLGAELRELLTAEFILEMNTTAST